MSVGSPSRRRTYGLILGAELRNATGQDFSSFARTPTVGTGITFTGGVADFDGTSNAVISYPDESTLETFPLSVSAWWRNDVATNSNGVSLITKASIAASPSFSYRGWYITYTTGTTGANGLGVSIVEDTFSKFRTWSNRTSYDDSTWRHICFTLDSVGGTPLIYVNGTLQTTYLVGGSAATTVATTEPVRLGGRAYFEQNTYFNGALSTLRLFNRVLTAAEVGAIYASTSGVTRP